MIRELTIDDVENFVEHLARHFPEPGVGGVIHNPYPPDEPLDKEFYIKRTNERLSNKPSEKQWEKVWGLFDGDQIVGHIDLIGPPMKTVSHRANLGMGIELNYRSKGFGKQLMKEALGWAIEQNFLEWIDLRVFGQNKAAIQLYEAFGFKRTGRVSDCFRVRGQKIDDIMMSLNLKTASSHILNHEKKAVSVFNPVRLDTKNVKIRPLQAVSWQSLAEGLLYENSYYATQWGIKTPDDIRKMYEKYIRAFENKLANPLVFLNSDESEVLGMTTFMNIEQRNKMLEIGGTWIGEKWQRTYVNTEAKFALLKYCFEALSYNRVEFRIDSENIKSQQAIQRLGMQLDGVMKNRVIDANGRVRDYHFYSIIKEQWHSNIKNHLLSLIK